MKTIESSSLVRLVFAAALLAPVGCAGGGDAIGRGVGIDNTTQALTGGTLAAIDGTYTGCFARTGAWSVRITGAVAMTNPPLSVVLNDTTCVLTVTALMNTSAVIIAASTPQVLGATYASTPSAFAAGAFYANAKLSAVDFAADFVVSVIFSDDPGLATGSNTAIYQSEVATATASSVPAPSYGAIDLTGIVLTTDANNVVYGETGSAVLTAGSQTGQTYVVVSGGGLTSYAAIDAAYLGGGTPETLGSSIPVADFSLHSTDLTGTQVRSLIIANTVSGIRSYQRFQLTFSPVP